MDTSLFVLRNEATATAFRHETLDDALETLNNEVGERDLWVLFELDRIRAATGGWPKGVATSNARGAPPHPATGGGSREPSEAAFTTARRSVTEVSTVLLQTMVTRPTRT